MKSLYKGLTYTLNGSSSFINRANLKRFRCSNLTKTKFGHAEIFVVVQVADS